MPKGIILNERLNKDNTYSADFIITLLAILVMSCLYHGARSVVICLISTLSCYFFEAIALKLQGKKIAFQDYSAVITGLIIGLMMPATIKYSMLIIISFVAMIVAKHIFGGSGCEIFNPAAVAYVFAAICWPMQVLRYPVTTTKLSLANYVDVSTVESFSSIFNNGGKMPELSLETVLGYVDGPIACTQIFVVFVCAIVLLLRRSVSVAAFLGFVGSYTAISLVLPANTQMDTLSYVFYELTTNMLLFAALFIVSDYRFLPSGAINRFIIGFLTAGFTLIFRRVANIENPVMFAVIITNPFVDVVDNYHTRFVSFIRRLSSGESSDETNSIDIFDKILNFILFVGRKISNIFVFLFENIKSVFVKKSDDGLINEEDDEQE